MLTEHALYKGAREILNSRDKWTVGQLARDMCGIGVSPHSDKAVCFCLDGALSLANGRVVNRKKIPTLLAIVRSKFATFSKSSVTIARFNDTHTYEDVIEIIDEAIATVEIVSEANKLVK
jgi:hypothetical protein